MAQRSQRVASLAAARATSAGIALVTRFRASGHLEAALDPLRRCPGPLAAKGRFPFREEIPDVAEASFQPSASSSSSGPPMRPPRAAPPGRVYVGRELAHGRRGRWWARRRLLSCLRSAYCSTIGFQAAHLPCPKQRVWWYRAAELPRKRWTPPADQRRLLLARLVRTVEFEQCLGAKYPSSKRFGLDGCETLVPGLFRLCHRAARHGVRQVELGMAHRGRLNVLANLLGKPMGLICAEMGESISEFHVGDVKYHLGISGTLSAECGDCDSLEPGSDPLQLSITPNPSHLEAVGPVVLGKVRAVQELLGGGDESQRQVMAVIVHGDAAFSGLGIALESMQLAALEGYGTGGSIHVVLNNQIGFTTEPHEARSSAHPSDFATGLGVPVLHVNADDAEAVDRAFGLAADWRAEFRRDVVVDLVGYRRFGHNELDDPEATQPRSYKLVKEHPPVTEIYERQLLAEGALGSKEAAEIRRQIVGELKAEYEERESHKLDGLDWVRDIYGGRDNRLWERDDKMAMPQTGLPLRTLHEVGRICCQAPDGFTVHPRVAKLLEKRKAMLREGGRVDFACAEMLAFASTLLHRYVWTPDKPQFPFPHRDIRLSGQDSKRGTFNQRHAVILDVDTAREWLPLDSMVPGSQARFSVHNSPLSEMAVLAFEYGYSLGNPDALVCWEAQFGDFANNAQVAIDQFIASGEERWGQTSSITLLLPHGYDGQGPDHSSARLERFLQLVNDDPDHLPGATPEEVRDMERAFEVLDQNQDGLLDKKDVLQYLTELDAEHRSEFQTVEEAWREMRRGQEVKGSIDRMEWHSIMQQWYRRNAEGRANIVVVNVSTPAQYFHVLRRQAHRQFKKPLVVMAPKYMLHHAKATSAFEDLGPGTFFRRVIADYNCFGPAEAGLGDNTRHLAVTRSGESLTAHPEEVRRLIICSGQMYYTLSNARRSRKIKDVAILRLEQIAPFPHDRITETISYYSNADVVWCQEEPKNMGAWFYVQPRLMTALRGLGKAGGRDVEVRYVGRPVAAATATGSLYIHQQQTRRILDVVFAA